jgi:hypothetical protein
MVTVSPFAEPIELDTVIVPVPGVAAVDDKVSVSVLDPLPMVIVWPAVGPEPEKVPVAVAPVALVVRLNVLGLVPAELVTVMVGAVFDAGRACTVPTAEAVVALVVRFNALVPSVIVTPWPALGAPVHVPVALAAIGGLASSVTPSTVTVELPAALLVVTVPVAKAAAPPISTFQSFLTGAFGVGFGLGRSGGKGRLLILEASSTSAALIVPMRLICCIV